LCLALALGRRTGQPARGHVKADQPTLIHLLLQQRQQGLRARQCLLGIAAGHGHQVAHIRRAQGIAQLAIALQVGLGHRGQA
jgi:hypothetical protein